MYNHQRKMVFCMDEYEKYSDEALQRFAVAGDSRAEDVLACRYVRLVRVCARPYFLAGGDSEDLTQEGMLGLLTAIREYDPEHSSSFRTFAERCILSRIYSAIKSAARKKHDPLNSGVSLEDAFGDETRTPNVHTTIDLRRITEDQVLAKENADVFFQTYSKSLSTLEQRILSLYLDGQSYRSIAALCGRDEKSVDNAIQRIRRKLARILPSGDLSES